MSDLLLWFRALWPVIVSLVSLSSLGIFLWLATKFEKKEDAAADRSRIDRLEDMRGDHDKRLALLEEHVEASPTKAELHEEINRLAQRMGRVETGIEGLGRQLSTANDYLHTLVEKGLRS